MSRRQDRSGYERVSLWNSDRRTNEDQLVHRLVAKCFVPEVDGKDCVNHIDGNKKNNHHSNLEWCTRRENMQHAWRERLCRPHKLTEDDVREILSCGGLDTDTAKRFGVSQVMVTRIRARQAWRHVQP